jgi:hypothetical protein
MKFNRCSSFLIGKFDIEHVSIVNDELQLSISDSKQIFGYREDKFLDKKLLLPLIKYFKDFNWYIDVHKDIGGIVNSFYIVGDIDKILEYVDADAKVDIEVNKYNL